MGIRWTEDLGAPAVVALADILTDEKKPTWNRPVGIGLAAAGYVLGGLMGMGGAFVKNLGIAAAPWAFGSIYQYIKESTAVTRRAPSPTVGSSVRRLVPPTSQQIGTRISRYPAQETKEQFENVRLVG